MPAASGSASDVGRDMVQKPLMELDLAKLKTFQRTFLCVGPVCLRSGVGFGLGVGCGVGVGRGWAPFVIQTSSGSAGATQFQVPMQFMQGIPGGYFMLDVLKRVMRNFPGSKTGAVCGAGVGYGVGIGLQYGGGRGMHGPSPGGFGASSSTSMGMSGQPLDARTGALRESPPSRSETPSPAVEGRLERIEKRLERMEESLALYNRVGELERKLEALSSQRGGRR